MIFYIFYEKGLGIFLLVYIIGQLVENAGKYHPKNACFYLRNL